jgi:DNA repair photolyase
MKRFGNQKPTRFDRTELKTDLGKGNFIFVGSSCDMFANMIDRFWIESILKHCNTHNENKYLFQTKNPLLFRHFDLLDHIDCVLCTTIESNRFYRNIMCQSPHPYTRSFAMNEITNKRKFVTIEPIMDFDLDEMIEFIKRCDPEQVNIGADSGAHKLPEPPVDKIIELVDAISKFTRINKKRNLERLYKTQTGDF